MRINEVAGGGGLRLQVREWGRADGPPILLIHGWSQCHPCWAGQYDSALADDFRLVALDLRNHGMSEAPLEQEHSTDPRLWEDDVQAVIDGSPPRAPGAGRLVVRRLHHLRLPACPRREPDRRDRVRRRRGNAERAGLRQADRAGLSRGLRRRHRRRSADQHPSAARLHRRLPGQAPAA